MTRGLKRVRDLIPLCAINPLSLFFFYFFFIINTLLIYYKNSLKKVNYFVFFRKIFSVRWIARFGLKSVFAFEKVVPTTTVS